MNIFEKLKKQEQIKNKLISLMKRSKVIKLPLELEPIIKAIVREETNCKIIYE